jgi:hypothetical protein
MITIKAFTALERITANLVIELFIIGSPPTRYGILPASLSIARNAREMLVKPVMDRAISAGLSRAFKKNGLSRGA